MRRETLNYRQILLGIILFQIAPFLLGKTAIADTLKTKDFRVIIDNTCPEGYVVCDEVTYNGVDLNTGASIQLVGRTVHTRCADGVTPCRLIGYEFYNGNYRYLVTEAGRLQVYQRGRLLLNQRGTWER